MIKFQIILKIHLKMRLINKTKKSIMINNFSSRKYFKKEFQ